MTRWLEEWRQGVAGAGDRLMHAAYPELNRIANRFLANERSGHTLDPNALVHELWLRMTAGAAVTIQDRSHFFALAARSMRQILIDHARARAADKRGGALRRVSLTALDELCGDAAGEDLLSLNSALAQLELADARAARVVELRYFGGLSGAEIAQTLGISEITVKRDWRAARAWLLVRLRDGTSQQEA
jgi:RNA polymerase sigma factor (TIGR02999 family)